MSIIQDISDFIFVNDQLEDADIIFLPGGSWPEPSEKAAELWHEKYARLILPSGMYSPKRGSHFPGSQTKKDIYYETYETEWDFMKSVLLHCGVDETAILLENRAYERGTLDNAFFSKIVTDSLNLSINKAIIVCKSFHARRCLMSYTWAYPSTRFMVCPVDLENTSKDNWYITQLGIDRVMTELQKCGQYFKEAIPLFCDVL